VPSSAGEYEVIIGEGVLADAGRYVAEAVGSTTVPILIIYDQALSAYGYPEAVQTALAAVFPTVHSSAVPSGEHSKSFVEAQRLYSDCVAAGLDRDAVIVALGGGVVGDLAGFIAATYMRGVRYIQMPTTIQAHDSSIGGKVAINLPEGKNLVGAFHAPQLVLFDVATLQSLSHTQRAHGLTEAVKHGVIRDAALFDWIVTHATDLLSGEAVATVELLHWSCRIKVDIVGIDERESGLRAILNFGHTIGHAIEAYEQGRMAHGAAVAIGMVLETQIAVLRGMTPSNTVTQITQALTLLGLPTQLPDSLRNDKSVAALIELMRHDKKASKRSLAFVLPHSIGAVSLIKDVPEEQVTAVLI